MGHLGLAVLGVGHHRAELEDRERLLAAADALLAKQHRPLAVELDRDRHHRQQRGQHDQSERRSQDVDRALGDAVAGREHGRAQAEQRRALQRVELRLASDHLEQARNDVQLDVKVVAGAHNIQPGVMAVAGEGQHHVLDAVGPHDLAEIVGRAQHRYVGQLRVQGQRVVVDEARQLEAVAGVSLDLARDLLPDQAGADDQRALQEGHARADEHTHDHAAQGQDRQGKEPEQDQAPLAGVHVVGQAAGHERQPHAHRDRVEQRPEVVERGRVGPQPVALVEAVEAGQREPAGHRQQKQNQLLAGGEALLCRRAQDHVHDREREPERPDIRHDQRAAYQRAPCMPVFGASHVSRCPCFDDAFDVAHRFCRGVLFGLCVDGCSAIIAPLFIHSQCPLLPTASHPRPYPPFG